ncbi:cytochrome c oxidase accessory protein CcoG [Ideonella livida]|uniref:Cytochrome c oxidase accessory protein CcoG n=1 Tax=Ideonella livida TaxID=2707176 RepID=A0A7C9PJK5_9BURK|nr:cytochrome c oxidase accessory protein CcoG [Ideonella livida]NDY93616.1 cytochrome c oxidase accessory protein CcoG [Ideonella livida]
MNASPLSPEPPPLPSGVDKIQARAVSGRYNTARWVLLWITQLVFYGLPWLQLQGRQAVLFDLESRRFFLFGAVFYPQDLIWLTLLLVASALLLFFAKAIAGRVWCGFACPQTVYTKLFSWIEFRLEGDRHARLRLDRSPWNRQKLLRRGGRHLAWALLALWTGISFVGYFTPIRSLVPALAGLSLGPWEWFWVLFYGLATWGNAGFLREQFCQHMCPYGRFQGSMMDEDTYIVGYDRQRGEPRGARSRQADAPALGLGACVDCTVCVQVCPVGIDIRQGLQAACIACGACIDACDSIMDRLRQPRGLVRFDTPHAFAGQVLKPWYRRPRVLIYGGLLGLMGAALVLGLWQRPTLRANVLRDRGVMARQVEDGAVENVYRLQVMNASLAPRQVQLAVEPDPGTQPPLPAQALQMHGQTQLSLASADAGFATVDIRLDGAEAAARTGQVLQVTLVITATEPDGRVETVRERSTFLVPR